ncbi:MAG TPA: NmrA family NAD(P)-binding protein [Verrucomicrobiae bacterium]|nr:NmrA family NAD(P)-binding protein [Verrucomicrobiae bacterium]
MTGNVGSGVAQALLAAGKEVRGIVRDKSKATHLAKQGVELVTGDISDTESLVKAMQGCEGVFVMNPPNFAPKPGFPEARASLSNIRSALAKAVPPKALYLSSIGAQHDRGLGLITQSHMLEEIMGGLPSANAFIRPAWFLENYQWDAQSARETGQIDAYLEPATKEFPMVATKDIGELAAKTLLESWKGNRILELEGPKRYSPLDAGKAFSKVLGREVNVHFIPRSQWQEKFVAQGTPADCTGARIEMVEGFNSGWIDFEGDGVERFKGKVTLEEVIKSLIAKNSAPA